MGKRRKLHQISIEEDIRYRGPLSYQGFQILGWLCIVLTAVYFILRLAINVDPSTAGSLGTLTDILPYFCMLSLAFLLIANFSRILNNQEGYKKQLIRNGGAAAAIILASFFFFGRYVAGSISLFVTDPDEVVPVLAETFNRFMKYGIISYNIFLDLFLCTLFMFFLNAKPKKVFTGKKVLFFRFLAILPVAYEIFSLYLKNLAAKGNVILPLWCLPLMTVKPPMTFVVFMFLAIHIKAREFRFCRHGRTQEEYQAFLGTNRNSLHFSVYLSILLIIASLADFFALIIYIIMSAPSVEALENTENIMETAYIGLSMGFGESIPLLFIAPVVLLFSYTRIPKNSKISMLIPVVGFILMFLIFIEGSYQVLSLLSAQVEHLPIRELFDAIFSGLDVLPDLLIE